MNICKVEGCTNKVLANGLCRRHYDQVRTHGEVLERTRFDLNEIVIEEDIAKVYLYDKDCKKCAECIIDATDVDLVKDTKWYATKNRDTDLYCTNNKVGPIHRFIMNAPKDMVVDHINHDTLDNRKENLRVCTNQQNIMNCKTPKNNVSKCKGVYWAKDKNKWTVQVTINNKTKYIGRYDDYETAVSARLDAERQYYGEFAYNDIKDN
jgi:hypothetical protein